MTTNIRKPLKIFILLLVTFIVYGVYNFYDESLSFPMDFSFNGLLSRGNLSSFDHVNINISRTVKESILRRKVEDKSCQIPSLNKSEDFFSYGAKEKIKCKRLKKFGKPRRADGSKFVCLDDRFQMTPGNCVVLSFGIAKNWAFDDAMDDFGCTVHSFDPTIGLQDFKRSENIHFHNLGLSSFNGMLRIGNKLCKVERYETILEDLGLLNTTIDYLKMDVEGSEIAFINDVMKTSPHLLKNVKQIGMEIHPLRPSVIDHPKLLKYSLFYSYWKAMHELECLGFRLAIYEMNRVKDNLYKWAGRLESCCYEVLWIKEESNRSSDHPQIAQSLTKSLKETID